jgi:hypothetical protein
MHEFQPVRWTVMSLSETSEYPEEFYLLRYNAVYSVESQPTFRRIISPPSSGPMKEIRWLVCAGFFFCLLEPTGFFETSTAFQGTTQRCIAVDIILDNHDCENCTVNTQTDTATAFLTNTA